MCCFCCCTLCEICKDEPEENQEDIEMTRTTNLHNSIPIAKPANKNLIIETNAHPVYRIEEGITTPNGTQIRRRTLQI